MTWIKTVRMDEDERVKHAMESQRKLYPVEYATPVATVRQYPVTIEEGRAALAPERRRVWRGDGG